VSFFFISFLFFLPSFCFVWKKFFYVWPAQHDVQGTFQQFCCAVVYCRMFHHRFLVNSYKILQKFCFVVLRQSLLKLETLLSAKRFITSLTFFLLYPSDLVLSNSFCPLSYCFTITSLSEGGRGRSSLRVRK
jgi:hypothetical protein